MNKNYAKLKEISTYFTEETLKNILHIIYNGREINILNWNFFSPNLKGDNYLSIINKVKVTGNIDGKKLEVNLVVKSLPTSISRRNAYRSPEFFRNEIAFYTKIVPKFEEFLKEKNQLQLLCIPRHYSSISDGNNDYIALEDISTSGYKTIDRRTCFDKDLCMIILKTLAKFHAISFALKDQKKETFMEIIEHVNETYFSYKHWNWYKNFHKRLIDISKNALAMEYPGSQAEEKFNSYKPNDLYQKGIDLCNRKYHSTSVITQGDSWIPNYMINKTTKRKVVMLDFQLARCTSPVLDVSPFIYVCTERSIWYENFDILLKFYYNELANAIHLLGSNPEKLYSWDTFMKEVKKKFIFGIIYAMELIPMSLLDPSEAFDLDVTDNNMNEEVIDIANIWTLSNIKSKDGRLRLASVIVHGVQNGFL
ncbi:hypothetical protein HZU73_06988 [Apis mellifera caucasica]|nr:hypothetical protein HZU73_06988 [Apis mellifera caucasica]KAG9437517.1 hypothetical protein HZU67_00526 [Apis mellifera carnica]